MTEEVKKLVESLREDAEWALANEWKRPSPCQTTWAWQQT